MNVIVWRVSTNSPVMGSLGYQWFATEEDAKRYAMHCSDTPVIAQFSVQLSKKGFLELLNNVAVHPDNG